MLLFVLFNLFVLAEAKRRLKVLVSAPSIGYSHMAFQGKLADLLVEAGHEVHVFVTEVNPAFTHFNGSSKAHRVTRFAAEAKVMTELKYMQNPFSGGTNMLLEGMYDTFQDLMSGHCRDLLEADHVIDSLRRERYDVIVAESMEHCMFGLAHAIGIPTLIGTTPVPMYSILARSLGIPSPSSFVPNMMAATISGDQMSYWERARSFLMNFYDFVTTSDLTQRYYDPLFRAKFGPNFPLVERIVANASLQFVNANPFFDLSRPITHKTIYIGGVAEKKPKRLSKDIEEIFDKATSGVILFSFGTQADTSKMSATMKSAFFKAFSRFPDVQFIWKLSASTNESDLFEQYENVNTVDWVDQVSVLAHPKTRGFISHAGLNSVNEASIHGVPMVTIPLFGDQLYNAAIANKMGVGVYQDVTQICEQSMYDALRELLENESYRKRAQRIKRKLQAQPFTPAETFVKWVEFAAEFPDLSELNLAGAEMSTFVYHSFDVLVPLFVILLTVLMISWRILRAAFRCIIVYRPVPVKKLQ